MKLKKKVLIYSMINNFLIALIKVWGGIFFHLSSLFSDGMHTFSDFITDIISLIATNISKKRATKEHPFGFGKIEYLSNLFIGVILFLLGIFIIITSFNKKSIIPSYSVLILLLVVILLKLIAIIILFQTGKKEQEAILITSARESLTDLYSSIGVVIIIFLLHLSKEITIFKYADLIGSILIGLIILKTSISIIIHNSLTLLGEVENNETLEKQIIDFLKDEKGILSITPSLIKYGSYYKLQLSLVIDPKLTLKQITRLINRIKLKVIRHRSFKVKYITIILN